ncbi:MAG: glutamate--tRNA ligase, partial [Proteobacteria bacterium]|nr:glutamate--tRNA ligase [Pseudomonadota bacterium]
LSNTPKQLLVLEAVAASGIAAEAGEGDDGAQPVYAHLPLLHGPDGKKLSKRHGAASVQDLRDAGYVPEAVRNYLVRLGWAHGDQEIFSTEEMIRLFDIGDVNHSASAINPDKLAWLNQHYIKEGDPEKLGAELGWHFERMGVETNGGPSLAEVVKANAERAKTLKEMAENSVFFYRDFEEYEEKAARKNLQPDAVEPLRKVHEALGALESWRAASIHDAVNAVADSLELKLGKVAQPIRVAIAGKGVSPPIDITLELLGRETALARIDRAIQHIAGHTAYEH